MGNHGSQCLEAHYAHLLGKHIQTAGPLGDIEEKKVGGLGSVLGGYSNLEDYGNSAYSRGKEELIRGIAEDVANVLKINSSFARTGSIKDVVAKFKKIVPDPRTNKKIKADSRVHVEVCKRLADAINNRYNMEIINKNAEPGVICQKVSELLYSLFTGLHSEFLGVAGDVTRIIKNLQVLKEYVDAANKKLMEDLAVSGANMVGEDASNIQRLYKKLSEEINRQHAILANLTNASIGPLGNSLIGLLENNNDFVGLTDDLKKMVGSVQFGEKLSHLLSGTADIADAAERVNRALGEIGLTVRDYKNVINTQDLRNKVYTAMMEKKPNSKELHKLLAAAEIINRNELAHDDIVSYLENKKGGYDFNVEEASFASDVDNMTWTDTSGTPFKGRVHSYRQSVGKQLQSQKRYRQMLFADFNKQIKTKYQQIIYVIDKFAKKIGSEIHPSPELEHFIKVLDSFANTQPNKHDLHLALSSYRTDSESSYVKHQYIQYLHDILAEAKQLSGRSEGTELFKQLITNVTSLIKLIDDFNSNFTSAIRDSHVNIEQPRSKYPHINGGDEYGGEYDGEYDDEDIILNADKERDDNLQDGDDDMGFEKDDDDEEFKDYKVGGVAKKGCVMTGGDVDVLGGIVAEYPENDFRHFVTLKRAIKKMDYYYKIANIRSNLKSTSVENEANVKNYENILGEEAGYQIDQIHKKYNALMADANGQQIPNDSGFTDYKELYKQGFAAVNESDNIGNNSLKVTCDVDNANGGLKEQLEGYKFLVTYIRQAKIEMLEAAQALDLYLSKFTRNIENDPDAIKNFSQIVEQLEVVDKWFTDKSGNNFCSVFEVFSRDNPVPNDFNCNGIGTAATAINKNVGNINNPDIGALNIDVHYYNVIEANDPGVFYKPRLMNRTQAVNFVQLLEKSIKSVRALENISNIFAKVNIHVNDNTKTFMSPGLIFKAFMKYCVATSISVGYKVINSEFGMRIDAEVAQYLRSDDDTKNTIDFANLGADIPNNGFAYSFCKMAVGLRFNDEYIKLGEDAVNNALFLHLCDPLETNHDVKRRNTPFCDQVFEMCIKSMVAKIYTVVGSYSLFHKPPKSITASDAMPNTALRQIMGGYDYIKIIPEATELYLRLPLLVEWYRKVFEFHKVEANEIAGLNNRDYTHQHEPLVSIVPEMDNVWGDLCKVIFIEGRNIEDGTYPSEYARRIIQSITSIYNHFSSKKSAVSCKEILQEFVLEINRRYGFMLRNEILEYIKDREYDYQEAKYGEDDVTDYDLLDTDNQFGRNVAPSDRFRSYNVNNRNERDRTFAEFNKAVKRFRYSVESNLLLNTRDDLTMNDIVDRDVSIDEIVRLTEKRLDLAKSDEDKYRIIHEQLHGVEKFSGVDQNKLLVYHETVINPLTVLYFTYLILNDYNKFMISMNLTKFKDVVQDYLAGRIPARNVTGNDLNAGNNNPPGAANVGALTSAGQSDLWLANQLLHYNNKEFKGSNNAFALPNANYTTIRESIYNVNDAKQYFWSGWTGDGAGVAREFGANGYLCAVGTNITIDDIDGQTHGAQTEEVKTAMMSRLLLNRSRLMEDTLRHLLNISCEMNDLVDVSYSGQGKNRYPVVNFDRLEKTCTSLFQTIKSSLEKLRRSIPYSLIDSVEKSKDGDNRNVVGLFWLQENLFDRLFKNKFGNGLTDANNGLKGIWMELTREHEFNWITAAHVPLLVLNNDCKNTTASLGIDRQTLAAPIRQIVANPNEPGVVLVGVNGTDKLLAEYRYDSYNDVISKLAFWDVTKEENNIKDELGFRSITMTPELTKFPSHFIPIFKSGGTPGIMKDVKNETFVLNYLLSKESLGTSAATYASNRLALDSKIVTTFQRQDDAKFVHQDRINFFLGAHNLYDYNVQYSNETQLSGEAKGDVKSGNLGGRDHIAPGVDIRNSMFFRKLGLLPKLNNILYNYINLFLDKSNKKIYKPLLEKFVNGYNSKDIIQAKNINDRVVCRQNFGILNDKKNRAGLSQFEVDATGAIAGRGVPNNEAKRLDHMVPAVCQLEPPENATLFASLAAALKTIMMASNERLTGNTPKYIEDNFANIPEYQKELMRAYLPLFEKQLELVCKRSTLLKEILENTRCKVYKWRQHYAPQGVVGNPALFNRNDGILMDENYPFGGVANLHHIFFQTAQENNPDYTQPLRSPIVEYEAARKTYLINIFTDLIATSKSLNKCIQSVSKELSDIPIYFETYNDSIIDYNNRNGQLPLMPLSNVTHLMNLNLHRVAIDNNVHEYQEGDGDEKNTKFILHILPEGSSGVGSTSFKFAYGTRGLLNYLQKPDINYAPGITSLLEYAKLGGSKDGQTQDLVSGFIKLARFVCDYQYHNNYLDAHGYNVTRKLLSANQRANRNRQTRNLTCQTNKGPADSEFWRKSENVVLLSDNDNYKQAVYRMVACLQPEGGKIFNSGRDKLRIYNILDTGIVPINFHALQREIPFINLMNYSYSFDAITKELIGNAYRNIPLVNIHGHTPDSAGNENKDMNASYDNNLGEATYTNDDFTRLYHSEDALVRQLIYPCGHRRLREFVNFSYKIASGATSFGLNRPKFLSDELWNKVLMNNLFDPRYMRDNMMRRNESRRQAELKQIDVDTREIVPNIINFIKNDNVFIRVSTLQLGFPAATAAVNAAIQNEAKVPGVNAPLLAAYNVAEAQSAGTLAPAAGASLQPGLPNRNNRRNFILALLDQFIPAAQAAVVGINIPEQIIYEVLRSMHNQLLPLVNATIFGIVRDFIGSLNAAGFLSRLGGGPGAVAVPDFAAPNADVLVMAQRLAQFIGSNIMIRNRQSSNVFLRVGANDIEIENDAKEPSVLGLLDFSRDAPSKPLIGSLSFITSRENKDAEITNVPVNNNKLQRVAIEGYLRSNTKLIRHTEWFVQLQRMIRILMRQQLEWMQDPVVSKLDALSDQVTEYSSDNRGFMVEDFQ